VARLDKAMQVVTEFLKKVLNVEDTKIIRITNSGDGWEAEAEVYEESSFIKSLGLPTRVNDRNIYKVRVDANLEVESYEREEQMKQAS